jgi:hypothetical protein
MGAKWEKLKKIVSKNPDIFEVDGNKENALITKAEEALAVRFPDSFKSYLLEWGSLCFRGIEYYGVTHDNFEKPGIPDVVWVNKHLRSKYGFPTHLVVFYDNDGVEYFCLDTNNFFSETECAIVLWDNVYKKVADSDEISFGEFLLEEVKQTLDID